jgi:hypothetical protein
MVKRDRLFGVELCAALGLDANRVERITLTVDASGTVAIEVRAWPSEDDLKATAVVLTSYEFAAVPKETAPVLR